jgi:hypothetical protein
MVPISAKTPSSDRVLYLFYDFETTQDTSFSDTATVHVPTVLCVQQFCVRCENERNIDKDPSNVPSENTFCEDDPVGDLLTYLCRPQQWANKIVAIAHNTKDFDLHFILSDINKWQHELIMKGQKVLCMRMEHLLFLNSVTFLPMALRNLPEAFGLTASKSWYPHYFNTKANMDYVGRIPGIMVL